MCICRFVRRPFEAGTGLNVARVAGPLQPHGCIERGAGRAFAVFLWRKPYLYRFRGMMAAQSETFSIAKYVVQGVVKDNEGNPVEGAALHIRKEVVYSDSAGRFLVRLSSMGPLR
jgi:hypothetical protein